MSQQEGFSDVVANPVTGSILIRHEATHASITSMVAQYDLLSIQTPSETPPPCRREHKVTNSDANKTLAVGLSGLGLVQLARGEITGSASENIWNAYRAHTHLSNPSLAGHCHGNLNRVTARPLRGPNGARDEFHLAATAQNLRKCQTVPPAQGVKIARRFTRKLDKLIPMPKPALA